MTDYSEFNDPNGRHPTSLHRKDLWVKGSVCPVCLKPFGLKGKTPHVDHNHRCCPYPGMTCGKCVRGLAHPGCNRYIISAWDRIYEHGDSTRLTNWQLAYITRGEPTEVSIRQPENVNDPLKRFSRRISQAVHSVCKRHGIHKYSRYGIDDVRQEAFIWVAEYAGIFDKPTSSSRRLARWSDIAAGDENQIQALLGYQLVRDLNQTVSRQICRDNRQTAGSLELTGKTCINTESAEEAYFREAEESEWDALYRLVRNENFLKRGK